MEKQLKKEARGAIYEMDEEEDIAKYQKRYIRQATERPSKVYRDNKRSKLFGKKVRDNLLRD